MGKKSSQNQIATSEQIQKMVHVVRGQRVMLDFDLARLYGVTTAALNQQVSRNRDRFPEDFAYQLTQKEFTSLMSQIAISNTGRGGRRPLDGQSRTDDTADRIPRTTRREAGMKRYLDRAPCDFG